MLYSFVATRKVYDVEPIKFRFNIFSHLLTEVFSEKTGVTRSVVFDLFFLFRMP